MTMSQALSDKQLRALRLIRNSLVHRGRMPTTLEIAQEIGRRSSRTGALMIQGLVAAGYLHRRPDGSFRLEQEVPEHGPFEETVPVPLVGCAPCGNPLLAVENVEATYRVSTRLVRGDNRYFLLRAMGHSMNEAGIQDGDLVLVRQQPTANDGDRVVALIDDAATIKEFHRSKEAIILRPRSGDSTYQSIILTSDFEIQGVVVGTIRLPDDEAS